MATAVLFVVILGAAFNMPKGHSDLPARIDALKAANEAQSNRIAVLERRIAEMNEAFSHARFPRAPQQNINGTPN